MKTWEAIILGGVVASLGFSIGYLYRVWEKNHFDR